MKSAVIVFPGSNCDRDAARALERITGKLELAGTIAGWAGAANGNTDRDSDD